MTYTIRQFVADQLRACAPSVGWVIEGIDRADELAGILVERAGVGDLSRVQLARLGDLVQTSTTQGGDANLAPIVDSTTFPALALSYAGGPWFGYLGENDGVRHDPYLKPYGTTTGMVAWSSAGHGNVSYIVAPAASGWVFLPIWASSSDAGDVRQALITATGFAVSVAMPLAGVQAGQLIGASILGPTLSAQYPLLAGALGNATLSATLNGGNIDAAVKGAFTNVLGSQAGAFVAAGVNSATDWTTLSSVAGNVTRAYITGGNLAMAAASGALTATSAPTSSTTTQGTRTMGDTLDLSTQDPTSFTSADIALASYGTTAPAIDLGNPLTYPDMTAAPVEAPGSIPAGSPSATFDVRGMVNDVSYAALQALKLVAAYKAISSPPVNTIARSVTSSGAVIAATDQGYVQTRDATGRITTQKPPVGVPQSTVTGNIVVNNGDGTYTLIDAMGTRRVVSYPTSGPHLPTIGGFDLSQVSAPVWIGLAGLAVTLMRSRR